MKKIVLTAAALLAISGSAFAGSDMINGSSGWDVLNGFAGNGIIKGTAARISSTVAWATMYSTVERDRIRLATPASVQASRLACQLWGHRIRAPPARIR